MAALFQRHLRRDVAGFEQTHDIEHRGGGQVLVVTGVDEGQLGLLEHLLGVQNFQGGAQAHLLLGAGAFEGHAGGADLLLVGGDVGAGGQQPVPRLRDVLVGGAAGLVQLDAGEIVLLDRLADLRGRHPAGEQRLGQHDPGGEAAVVHAGRPGIDRLAVAELAL